MLKKILSYSICIKKQVLYYHLRINYPQSINHYPTLFFVGLVIDLIYNKVIYKKRPIRE